MKKRKIKLAKIKLKSFVMNFFKIGDEGGYTWVGNTRYLIPLLFLLFSGNVFAQPKTKIRDLQYAPGQDYMLKTSNTGKWYWELEKNILPGVNLDTIVYTPLDSGNIANNNSFVIDPNGDTYFISADGDGIIVDNASGLDQVSSSIIDTIEAHRQILSISNDTVFLSDGGYVIIPIPAAACNIVTDYGADNTGTTDNYAIITQAIAECDGNMITFPDGVYLISDMLVLNDNTNLVGLGDVEIKLTAAKDVMVSSVANFTPDFNLQLVSLTFNGNNLADTILSIKAVSQYNTATIRNLELRNSLGTGFYAERVQGSIIENLSIENCEVYGADLRGCNDLKLHTPNFSACGVAIHIEKFNNGVSYSGGVIVDDYLIQSCTGAAAVVIDSTLTPIIFNSGWMEANAGDGFTINAATYVSIDGLRISADAPGGSDFAFDVQSASTLHTENIHYATGGTYGVVNLYVGASEGTWYGGIEKRSTGAKDTRRAYTADLSATFLGSTSTGKIGLGSISGLVTALNTQAGGTMGQWLKNGTTIRTTTLTDLVGIGVNVANANLHVVGTATTNIKCDGPTNPYIRIEDTTNPTRVKMQSNDLEGLFGTESLHPLSLYINNTRKATLDVNGHFGIGTFVPTAFLDINSDVLRLRTAKTPASAGAAGNQGDIAWDANFIYICTATNTWKRVAISTW